MLYRRLGKTDLMVSEVSFGGHQTGGYGGKLAASPKERAEVIARSLELGVTYFDTTIEFEAESLSSVFGLLGGKPDDVVVTSMYVGYKTFDDNTTGVKQKVLEAIDNSLKYFDPIDIFNLCGNGLPYSRERTLDALEAVDEARQKGKVRHCGFSTHLMEYALSMIENHPEIGLVMFPYNVLIPRVGDLLFPTARQHDVGIVAMKALAARALLNLEIETSDYGRDLSLALAAVKWVLQNPAVTCTIPAMNSVGEVEENLRASGATLGAAELSMLEATREAFAHRAESDPDWYYLRDWSRRLHGEDPAEARPAAGD